MADDVAQNGMYVISYDQWKVNKFCLLSDGIIGNKILAIDLQNATLCHHMKRLQTFLIILLQYPCFRPIQQNGLH